MSHSSKPQLSQISSCNLYFLNFLLIFPFSSSAFIGHQIKAQGFKYPVFFLVCITLTWIYCHAQNGMTVLNMWFPLYRSPCNLSRSHHHFLYQHLTSRIFPEWLALGHNLTMSSNDPIFCCISRIVLKSKSIIDAQMHKHLNLINVHGMVSSKEFPLSKQSQHDILLWSITELSHDDCSIPVYVSAKEQSWICLHQ